MENLDIGRTLRQGRLRKGISQVELAKKLGVNPASISRWEANQQMIAGDSLIEAAKILEIETELFPITDKSSKNLDTRSLIHQLQKEIESLKSKRDEEDSKHLQILIVEDDLLSFITVQEALLALEKKFLLAHAKSAEDALTILQYSEKPTCLIILDLLLPGMNGIEFLKMTQQDEKFARIPVIIYTALDIVLGKIDYEGVYGYMKKPFDLRKFVDLLGKIDLSWPLKSTIK